MDKEREAALGVAVGKAIARKRIEAGFTQETVAEQLQIGNEAVSRMERGLIVPTLARLVDLADVFDCPIADLVESGSDRGADQAAILERQLGKVSKKDRSLLLDVLGQLVDRLRRG